MKTPPTATVSGDEFMPVRRLRAGGVLKDERGRILLARAGAGNPDFPGRWCLPGGGVEHGEHPEETVVREFREETGLEVRVDCGSFTVPWINYRTAGCRSTWLA